MSRKKYTEEEFIRLVKQVNPHYQIVGKFINTSSNILVKCDHSLREIVAWQLLKSRKYCCNEEYHRTRIPSQTKSIETRRSEVEKIFNGKIDASMIEYNTDRDKILNLRCVKHDKMFDKWVSSLMSGIGCPECHKEINKPKSQRALALGRKSQIESGKAKFVSKTETEWLDSLNVPIRQKWLADVKYCVDGFNPDTNTVYLYHGRFWHGCLDTYSPEEIHPILKVTMKQLNEQTLLWEQKIQNAGYNLIVKWGR